MARRMSWGLVLFVFLVTLSGCATGRKERNMEVQGLRNQISALEAQVQSKEEEISSLREALSRAGQERPGTKITTTNKIKVVPEIKSRPNIKQIQTALQNAGYAPGALDGKLGRQTRDAIRAFQRANNLPVDGKVGKQTWSILKEYLYKKVK